MKKKQIHHLIPGDGIRILATAISTVETKITTEGPDEWEAVKLDVLLQAAEQTIHALKVEVMRLTERAEIAEGVIEDMKAGRV